MKKLLCISAVIALSACSMTKNQESQSPEALFATYKDNAQQLVSLISEQGNDAKVEKYSATLVQVSQPILKAFIKKFPQCDEYLTAVSKAADIIPTLPLSEIESGYHADGKLPQLTDANCYHAKDLLVHPATVQAMAVIGIKTDKQREQAKHEVEEVLTHFAQVETAFNKL